MTKLYSVRGMENKAIARLMRYMLNIHAWKTSHEARQRKLNCFLSVFKKREATV